MSNRVHLLRNQIQNYAWGSHDAISRLLGRPYPSVEPEAEMWMGSHPKATSQVYLNETWTDISKLIEQRPQEVLGDYVYEKFGSVLPFLFKILAAEQPLSIQTHPNAQQAVDGFEAEERAGIDIKAANRNYRDRYPKPELLCALEPFEVLSGFREIDEIIDGLSALKLPKLEPMIDALRDGGIRPGFEVLVRYPHEDRLQLVADVVVKLRDQLLWPPEVSSWVCRLAQTYPGDPGVLAPMFLNYYCLKPGEALQMYPRELHAYLRGVAVELMACSDNVLRAGLTSKHVDPEALIGTVLFESIAPRVVSASTESKLQVYPPHAEQFRLSRVEVNESTLVTKQDRTGVEIYWVYSGTLQLVSHDTQVKLSAGDSILVEACLDGYRLDGHGLLYRADVPPSK